MGQQLSVYKSAQLAWESAKHHQFMPAVLFQLSENSFNMMAGNLVFLTLGCFFFHCIHSHSPYMPKAFSETMKVKWL